MQERYQRNLCGLIRVLIPKRCKYNAYSRTKLQPQNRQNSYKNHPFQTDKTEILVTNHNF